MKKLSTFILALTALLMLPMTVSAYDVEVASIAEFNAVADGQVAKLTLTNARVNASLYNTFYVEDASGATAIKGVNLTVGTALNGYIVGKKGTEDVDYVNDPSQGLEYSLTVEDASQSSFEATSAELVGTPMTIAEACEQVNYGKLVTVSNISITPIGNGNNRQLTDATGNMRTRDLLYALPDGYTWPEQASKMTGLLLYYMNGWYLVPISVDAIVPYVQPTEVTFDFFNNNLNLPYGQQGTPAEVKAGDLSGKSITQDGVVLNFVSPATIPTRYYLNGNRGLQYQNQTGGQMRVTAPKGYAVTEIISKGNKSVNAKTGAISYQNSWTVNKGGGSLTSANQETQTWTGNAESVRLNSGTCYIEEFKVTIAPVNNETLLRADEKADDYAEVNGLTAFKDAANNALVKLTLTDAIITSGMINEEGFYVQDATGGAHFYYTGLEFEVGDVLNGTIYVKKSTMTPGNRIAMTEDTNVEGLTITKNGIVTPTEGTIAEINVAENNCRVVKLTGVKVKGTEETKATVTDGNNNEIIINNSKVNNYPYVIKESLANIDYTDATVVGILVAASSGNQIMPLSITGTSNGIQNVSADFNVAGVKIYNLQGVRLNQLQKGLNIVNGKKVVIK